MLDEIFVPDLQVGMKICRICHVEQPLTSYNRNGNYKDGLQNKCKSCCKAYDEAYRKIPEKAKAISANKAEYREKNKGKVNKASRDWHYANREEQNARRLANYYANIERERASKAAAYQRRADEIKEITRQYKKNNVERVRVMNRNRKAKKRAGGKHTLSEVRLLLAAQQARCNNPFCRVELTVKNRQLDHIQPVSKGGKNDIKNLQAMRTMQLRETSENTA